MKETIEFKNAFLTLKAFSTYPNLFILGAGVSYGITPTTDQMKDQILDYWIELGGYPVVTEDRSHTFKRVMGDLNSIPNERQRLYAELLNNSSVEWLLSFFLANDVKFTFNYGIFNLFPYRSTFLDFNLDSYSEILRKNHIVLKPHGKIPLYFKYMKVDLKEILEFPDLKIPWNEETVLICPEYENLLRNKEFDYLINNWSLFNYIIIIGYSFARNNNDIDDYYTFRFITEMIRYKNKKIILIDPFPDHLLALLEKEIKLNIIILRIKWDIFSRVLYSLLNERRWNNLYQLSKNVCLKYDLQIKGSYK